MPDPSFELAHGIVIGGGAPLVLVAGPCAIESEELAVEVCGAVKDIAMRAGVPFVFKSSYDKANRQSIESFRGPGIDEGLAILGRIRDTFGVPVLTDVHSPGEAERAGGAVDIVQLPAFLNRQTDLAVACGRTGRPVFVKKAQFMAPEDMGSVVRKVNAGGSERVVLVERGTAHGYHDLVVDMRSFPVMRGLGCPVVHDCTHSVQRPGAGGGMSGGDPRFIETLARAAVGAGVDGVFIETHPRCDEALCDAATMLPLDRLEQLLGRLTALHDLARRWD